MTKNENKDEYKKPELINIDDPAFDERGQGSSLCPSVYLCKNGSCPNCRSYVCELYKPSK